MPAPHKRKEPRPVAKNYNKELQILYAACAAHFGIVVRISDWQRCLQNLYSAKRTNPEMFDDLTIRRSPDDPANEIWIVHVGELTIQPPAPKPGEITLADVLGDL
jgi:hypothetical protein